MHDDSTGAASTRDKQLLRNRAITWARYIIDSSDWVILALRATVAGDNTLISVALQVPGGKVSFERLIRLTDFSARDAMGGHGIDYEVLLNALSFSEVMTELEGHIQGKQVLVWDPQNIESVLTRGAADHGASRPTLTMTSVSDEYRKFSDSESVPELKGNGLSARSECQAIHALIEDMASTSQRLDGAKSSPIGWTAEFYKPNKTAADKLKGFLGIE